MTDPFRADEFKFDVDLPAREFMYTIDQIAFLLDINEDYMKKKYLFLPGRSTGRQMGRIRCTNIARPDQAPNWRIAEEDFMAWMRYKGIRFSERRPVRGAASRKR